MLKTKETRKMWSPLRVFSPRKNHVANLSSNRKRAALERKKYIYIYLYIYKYIFCRTFHGGNKNVHSLPYGERII